MKNLLIFAFSFIFLNIYSQNDNFEKNIRKMIDIQGSKKNYEVAMAQMLQLQKKSFPMVDSSFWNRFEKELYTSTYRQLDSIIIPIYKKYLSEEDVKSIIAFYESDAGKTLTNKSPMIISEIMLASETLGKKIALKIQNEIEQKKNENFNVTLSDCKELKTGKFKCIMPDSSILIIERDNKFQYEYHNGTTTKYKIEWLSESKYTLKVIKTNSEMMKKVKDRIFTTNIYEFTDKYYKFICTIDGMNFKMDGIIYRL